MEEKGWMGIDMGSFQSKVKKHLGEYKKDILKTQEDGVFIYRGKEILYEHIIPSGKEHLNIIEKYRNDFFASSFSKNMTFHRYFHHLNSSQAMCINCFYPLIKEQLLELVLKAVGINGSINYNSNDICFEKESELEKSFERKTNFDFYIKLDSEVKLFFEIKYTENGFGKAKLDKEHIDKFNSTYKSILEQNSAIEENFKSEETFLNNYQIMRNLLNINKNSYVIFIYPDENKIVKEEALSAKRMIKCEWQNHFILFTWEEFIKKIESCLSSKDLID